MTPELTDITPLDAKESWETWVLLLRQGIKQYTWNQWIDMWRPVWKSYWESHGITGYEL